MTPEDFFGLAERSGETPAETVARFLDFFARCADDWQYDDTNAAAMLALRAARDHLRSAAAELRASLE